MKLKFLAPLLLAASFGNSHATISLTTLDSPITTTFSDFTAPATWATSTPSAGQLDSDTWAFTTGTRTSVAAVYGGDATNGQGTSTGGVGTNGIYAFTVASGVTALGFQATGSFGSPGSYTVRIANDTGDTLNTVSIAYTAWYLNNAPRAGVLRPYYSLTNNGATDSYLQADGSNQDVNSPEAADTEPVWVSASRSFDISGLDLADGDVFFFRFGFNDSGSSTRDEWGISSFTVTAVPEPSSALLGGLGMLALLRRRR
jgi:hypothetical protein